MLTLESRLTLPAWIHERIDTRARYADDTSKVQLAITLAQHNIEDGGGPFGAAVFDSEGQLLGAGVNRVVPEQCSVAHAEMMAYLTAQAHTGRARLNQDHPGVTLATSAQPCCMCYGATFWAGIDTLLIGASAADVMQLTEFDEGPLPADWRGELEKRGIAVREAIARDDARAVLAHYAQRGGIHY
ncbi:nucleoside deaminase [Denitratimonas sp. CY0512]|uniref:nucleoside deaminase n=1 Tax=Denitratimonas sp. CY0512 TaxID=3131940 RepID=UPI0030A1F996